MPNGSFHSRRLSRHYHPSYLRSSNRSCARSVLSCSRGNTKVQSFPGTLVGCMEGFRRRSDPSRPIRSVAPDQRSITRARYIAGFAADSDIARGCSAPRRPPISRALPIAARQGRYRELDSAPYHASRSSSTPLLRAVARLPVRERPSANMVPSAMSVTARAAVISALIHHSSDDRRGLVTLALSSIDIPFGSQSVAPPKNTLSDHLAASSSVS